MNMYMDNSSHKLGSKGMHLVIILEVWGGLTTYHRLYCVIPGDLLQYLPDAAVL